MKVMTALKKLNMREFERTCNDLIRAMSFKIEKSIYRENELILNTNLFLPGEVSKYVIIILRTKNVDLPTLEKYVDLDLVGIKWMIITTGDMTDDALKFANENEIIAIDKDGFDKLLNDHGIKEKILRKETEKNIRESSFLPSLGEIDNNLEWAEDFFRTKNYEKALEYVEKTLQIKDNIDATHMKAKILHEMGKSEEALVILAKALKENQKSEIWTTMGNILLTFDKEDEALEAYNHALKLNRNDLRAWLSKGLIMHKNKKLDEALLCYNHAIVINKKIPEVWNDKGVALKELGKVNDALKCYDMAFYLNKNYYEPIINKAILYYDTKKYKNADECVKIYLENKKDLRGWVLLAYIKMEKNEKEEALKAFKKAIKMDPTNEEIKQQIKDLKLIFDKDYKHRKEVMAEKEKELNKLKTEIEVKEKSEKEKEKELKKREEDLEKEKEKREKDWGEKLKKWDKELKIEREKSEGEVKVLQEKLKDMENREKGERKELEKLQNTVKEKEDLKKAAVAELKRLKKQLEVKAEKEKEERKELEKLKETVEQKEDLKKAAVAELKRLKKQLEDKDVKSKKEKEKLQKLEKNLKEKEGLEKEAKEELTELEEKLKEKEKDEKSKNLIKKLEEKLKNKEEEDEKTKKEIGKLSKELKDREKKEKELLIEEINDSIEKLNEKPPKNLDNMELDELRELRKSLLKKMKNQLEKEKETEKRPFEKALKLYYEKNLEESLDILNEILEENEHEGANVLKKQIQRELGIFIEGYDFKTAFLLMNTDKRKKSKEVLEVLEEDKEWNTLMGVILYDDGNLDSAQKYFERAYALEKNDETAFNLSGTLALNNKEKEAYRFMKEIVDVRTVELCIKLKKYKKARSIVEKYPASVKKLFLNKIEESEKADKS